MIGRIAGLEWFGSAHLRESPGDVRRSADDSMATAKAPPASRNASAIVTRSSLSGYSVLFADVLPPDFLAAIDPTSRQRSFGHLPVFWAWLAQILEANASCQKAVGHIQSWAATCGLPVPSSDTSSYGKARRRRSQGTLRKAICFSETAPSVPTRTAPRRRASWFSSRHSPTTGEYDGIELADL